MQNTCWPLPCLPANLSSQLSRKLCFLLAVYTQAYFHKEHGHLLTGNEKRIEKFTCFLIPRREKSDHYVCIRGCVISCSYFCTECNALCSAKTSRQTPSLPSLFTCSAKHVHFGSMTTYTKSMTVSQAALSHCLFSVWNSIWSMDPASLAAARQPQASQHASAAKMMCSFQACLPACSFLLGYC